MAEKYVLIRNKLDKKVFTPYGIDSTRRARTAVTNDWGEVESYNEVTSTIVMVPYDIVKNQFVFESFSIVDKGEFEMACPYDTTLNTDDTVELYGEQYVVKEELPIPLLQNVVKIYRFKKLI